MAAQGGAVRADFAADAEGWYQAELAVGGVRLIVERWLADEEGIRGELNAWAAFLETCEHSPEAPALMERVIQTKQLFTIRKADEDADDALAGPLCVALSRHLAEATGGVYQVDDTGFFAADGRLLVRER